MSRFLYIDDDNAVQGPFTGGEMLQWLKDGFFQLTTPLWKVPDAATEEAARAAANRDDFQPFQYFYNLIAKEVGEPIKEFAAAEPEPTPATTESAATTAVTAVLPTPTAAADIEPTASHPTSGDSSVAATSAAVAPAAVPVVPSASASEVEWYYADDAGEERGPFPTSDMSSWLAAGFFGPQTKVRTASESVLRPLGERAPGEVTFAPAAPAMPAAAAVSIEDEFETDMDKMEEDDNQEADAQEHEEEEKKKADEEHKESKPKEPAATVSLAPSSLRWYYTEPSGVEQGPFTARSMLKWHRAGYFAFNDTPLRREDESQSLPLSARSNAPSFYSASLAGSTTRLENRWYYLDSKDDEQGPFTEEQMRGWWNAKFLKPTLKVRQVGEDETAFSPISSRDCSFTRPPVGGGSGAAPSAVVNPVVHAQQPYMMQQQHYMIQQPQYPQAYPTAPMHGGGYGYPQQQAQQPYYAGQTAPAYPYQGYLQQQPYAAAAGGYAGYAQYGGAAAAYPMQQQQPPPPPHRGDRSDYAQSASFSGHRGRGRHIVAGNFGDRPAHDPLSGHVAQEQLDSWANKRQRR